MRDSAGTKGSVAEADRKKLWGDQFDQMARLWGYRRLAGFTVQRDGPARHTDH